MSSKRHIGADRRGGDCAG